MSNVVRAQFIMRGQPRRVLEIEQRSNGDLMIFPKFIEEVRRGGKQYTRMKHNKFSVHRSLESEAGGFTIIRTSDTPDDQYSDAIFVTPENGDLRWLTYGFTVPLSSPRMEKTSSKGKIQIETLGIFDPDVTCATVAMIVSSPNVREAGPPVAFASNARCIKFDNFNIHLWINYMNVPSIFNAQEFMALTSPSRRNGEPFEGRTISDARSHSVASLFRIQKEIMDRFAAHYLNNFFEDYADAKTPINSAAQFRMRMSIKPIFSPQPATKSPINVHMM